MNREDRELKVGPAVAGGELINAYAHYGTAFPQRKNVEQHIQGKPPLVKGWVFKAA